MTIKQWIAILILGVVVVSGVSAQGRGQGKKPQPPPPSTTRIGERKLLAILVNFQDKQTEPYSVGDVATMLGTVDAFYRENSSGIAWVTSTVTGWHTMPVNVADCSGNAIQQNAEAAARQAGYEPRNFQHVFYVFDFASECLNAGLTGGGTSTIGDIGLGYSFAWIHLSQLRFDILAHEFGHGLGLLHSRPMDCGAVVLCASPYPWSSGDAIDIMGGSDFMHVNAFYKERLGWANQLTVTQDGTYTIQPVVSTGAGPRALKILKSQDKFSKIRTFYYVELHQNVGFEDGLTVPSFGFLDYTNYFNGLTIRMGTEGDGWSSWLLDLTPNSNATPYLDIADGALLPGQIFIDPTTGLAITAQGVSSAGATVSVDLPGR